MGGNDNIKIAAAFFAGFHRMMTLLLNLNGSFLTLIRFGISPTKIGCFIGDTGSCMQFWNNCGILLSFGLTFCGWIGGKEWIAPVFCTVIYCLAFAYTWHVKRFSGEVASKLFIIVLVPIVVLFALALIEKGENGKYVCPVVSIFSSIALFVAYCMLAWVCSSSHGNEGVRKLYFWLCASAFAYQFDQCMVTKVNGAQAAWFFLALELYGPLLPLLHWLAGLFGKRFGFDIESAKLRVQIGTMIVCPFCGMCLWIVNAAIQIKAAHSELADMEWSASLLRCLSPGFIGAIGLGSVFWLFPVVYPFMVCHYSWFRFVMFFSPILGASATLIVWAINDGGEIAKLFKPELGPFYDIKDATKFNIWSIYGRGTGGWFYHLFWLLLLFIFILVWILICCVHYPRCYVARCVLHSGWAVFYGCWLYFISQLYKAFGLTGVFSNAIGPWFNTGGLTIANGVTISGTASIEGSSGKRSVKIQNFNIGLGTTDKDITGTLLGNRDITESVNLDNAGEPKIILYGFIDIVSTSALSKSTSGSPSGTFTGNDSDSTITCTSFNLNITSRPGGTDAAKIEKLTMIKITQLDLGGVQISSTTVNSATVTLAFGEGIAKKGNNFTLNGQTVTGTFTFSSYSGTVSGTIQTGSVTIAGQNVTITALNFETGKSLTISGVNGVHSGSGNIGTSHTVTIHGSKSAENVKSLPVTVTDAPTNISLSEDSSTTTGTLKLNATQAANLNLSVSDQTAGEGQYRAGSFTSSGTNAFLTKMEISLYIARRFNIDGFPVGGKVVLKLVLGITGASGFSVTDKSNVNTTKSSFSIPGDLAHGSTFGNVFVDFALFHMTASLFTAQAYSVGIASFKCAVDSGCAWPTQGLGGFRSFWWWLGYGLKKGNRRFKSLAHVDIIQVIS